MEVIIEKGGVVISHYRTVRNKWEVVFRKKAEETAGGEIPPILFPATVGGQIEELKGLIVEIKKKNKEKGPGGVK